MHFLIDFLLGCHIKQQEQEGINSMNKEGPYREQAEKLRQKIDEPFEEGQVVQREELTSKKPSSSAKTKEK